jgi:hypothetical protein
VEECKRKHPLNLIQSNIGLLRVFEPIEYRDWDQLVEGNDCFFNKPEILNKPPFIWSFSDSKNRRIVGAGAID